VKGYSTLSAGVHTLPFAGVVMVMTPVSALLALKWGARYVVAAGLAIVAAALFWGSTVSTHAAYFGPVIAMMMLLAFGFSLINAPSTASLMGTLRPDQVGAGAAVNETTRELAGALGVAVIGSTLSSFFGPGVQSALGRFVGHGLTNAQLHLAMSSTPAAQATIAHFPAALRPALNHDVTNAFMSGLHHGCFVAAAVALAAGVIVFRRMPGDIATNHVQPALADAAIH
jgi:DHA2 family multidrug resistance protein-like MFS transporter